MLPIRSLVFRALAALLLAVVLAGPSAWSQTVTLADPDPAAASYTTTDSTYTLRGDVTGIQGDGITEGPVWRVEWGVDHKGYGVDLLDWGVPVRDLSGDAGSEIYYRVELPPGVAGTRVYLSALATGDADLYVRRGALPTTATWDCRPFSGGTFPESCGLDSAGGTFYIMVRGFSAYTGGTLEAAGSLEPGGTQVLRVQAIDSFDGDGALELDGTFESSTNYAVAVPPGGSQLEIGFWAGVPLPNGLSSDAALNVAVGSAAGPDTECFIGDVGVDEFRSFQDPVAGIYSINLYGCDAYQSLLLYAAWNGPAPLENGVPLTDLSGAALTSAFYTLSVPPGARDLRIRSSGGTGDVDLRARFGERPDFSFFDCVSATAGNDETCYIAEPQAGIYHLMFRTFDVSAGVTLEATWREGFSVSGYATGGTIDAADLPAGSRPWTAPGIPLKPGRNVITVFGTAIEPGAGVPPAAPEPLVLEVWRLPPTDLLQDGVGLEINGTAVTQLDAFSCPAGDCVSGNRAKLASGAPIAVGSTADFAVQIAEGVTPQAIYLLIDDLVVASSTFSNALVADNLPLGNYSEGSLHELSVAIEIDDGTGIQLQKLLFEEFVSSREVDSLAIQFVGPGLRPAVIDETDRYWQSLSRLHDPAAPDLADQSEFNVPWVQDLAVFESAIDSQDPSIPRAWVLTGSPSRSVVGPTPAGVDDEVRFYYDLVSGSGGAKMLLWHDDEWFDQSISPNCATGCITGSVPDPPANGSLILTAVAPTLSEDWVWLGTNNGLMCARISTTQGTNLVAQELYRVGDGPAGSWVSDLDVLPDGTLWVGHRGSRWYGFAENATRRYYEDWGGVSRWVPGGQACQGGTWTNWRSRQTDDWTWEGVAGFQIASVSAVSGNQVWAASEAGLSFWDGSSWTHETVETGMPFDDVAIVEAGPTPGEVWMTGDPDSQSGIAWRRDGTWGQAFVRDPLTGFVPEVNDLALDARGVVWFATPEGAISFDPETLQRIPHLGAVIELPDAVPTGDGCSFGCGGGALFPHSDGRMNTAFSDFSRATVSMTTAADPPVLLTPMAGDVISSPFLGIDLAFEPVPFATGYQILVDGTADPTLLPTQTVIVNSQSENGKRVQVLPGMHNWSVRAIYPDGRAGPPSLENKFGLLDERTETSTGALLAYRNNSGETRVLDLYRPRGTSAWQTGVIDPGFSASSAGAAVPLAAGADGRLVSVSTGLNPEQYPSALRDDIGNRPEVSRVAVTSEPEGLIFGDSASMSVTLYNELLGTTLCADTNCTEALSDAPVDVAGLPRGRLAILAETAGRAERTVLIYERPDPDAESMIQGPLLPPVMVPQTSVAVVGLSDSGFAVLDAPGATPQVLHYSFGGTLIATTALPAGAPPNAVDLAADAQDGMFALTVDGGGAPRVYYRGPEPSTWEEAAFTLPAALDGPAAFTSVAAFASPAQRNPGEFSPDLPPPAPGDNLPGYSNLPPSGGGGSSATAGVFVYHPNGDCNVAGDKWILGFLRTSSALDCSSTTTLTGTGLYLDYEPTGYLTPSGKLPAGAPSSDPSAGTGPITLTTGVFSISLSSGQITGVSGVNLTLPDTSALGIDLSAGAVNLMGMGAFEGASQRRGIVLLEGTVLGHSVAVEGGAAAVSFERLFLFDRGGVEYRQTFGGGEGLTAPFTGGRLRIAGVPVEIRTLPLDAEQAELSRLAGQIELGPAELDVLDASGNPLFALPLDGLAIGTSAPLGFAEVSKNFLDLFELKLVDLALDSEGLNGRAIATLGPKSVELVGFRAGPAGFLFDQLGGVEVPVGSYKFTATMENGEIRLPTATERGGFTAEQIYFEVQGKKKRDRFKVDAISPSTGVAGDVVEIRGRGFDEIVTVLFGTTAEVLDVTPTLVRAVVPVGVGTVNVRVVINDNDPANQDSRELTNAFTYGSPVGALTSASSGPVSVSALTGADLGTAERGSPQTFAISARLDQPFIPFDFFESFPPPPGTFPSLAGGALAVAQGGGTDVCLGTEGETEDDTQCLFYVNVEPTIEITADRISIPPMDLFVRPAPGSAPIIDLSTSGGVLTPDYVQLNDPPPVSVGSLGTFDFDLTRVGGSGFFTEKAQVELGPFKFDLQGFGVDNDGNFTLEGGGFEFSRFQFGVFEASATAVNGECDPYLTADPDDLDLFFRFGFDPFVQNARGCVAIDGTTPDISYFTFDEFNLGPLRVRDPIFETNGDDMEFGLTVGCCKFPDLTGRLRIADGDFDFLSLSATFPDPGKPLPSIPGVFLRTIGGSYDHSLLEFRANALLTGGPTLTLPSFLVGTGQPLSLVTMTGEVRASQYGFRASAGTYLFRLEGVTNGFPLNRATLAIGQLGYLDVPASGFGLYFGADVNLFYGILNVKAEATILTDRYSGSVRGTVGIPDDIPIIGGIDVGGGSAEIWGTYSPPTFNVRGDVYVNLGCIDLGFYEECLDFDVGFSLINGDFDIDFLTIGDLHQARLAVASSRLSENTKLSAFNNFRRLEPDFRSTPRASDRGVAVGETFTVTTEIPSAFVKYDFTGLTGDVTRMTLEFPDGTVFSSDTTPAFDQTQAGPPLVDGDVPIRFRRGDDGDLLEAAFLFRGPVSEGTVRSRSGEQRAAAVVANVPLGTYEVTVETTGTADQGTFTFGIGNNRPTLTPVLDAYDPNSPPQRPYRLTWSATDLEDDPVNVQVHLGSNLDTPELSAILGPEGGFFVGPGTANETELNFDLDAPELWNIDASHLFVSYVDGQFVSGARGTTFVELGARRFEHVARLDPVPDPEAPPAIDGLLVRSRDDGALELLWDPVDGWTAPAGVALSSYGICVAEIGPDGSVAEPIIFGAPVDGSGATGSADEIVHTDGSGALIKDLAVGRNYRVTVAAISKETLTCLCADDPGYVAPERGDACFGVPTVAPGCGTPVADGGDVTIEHESLRTTPIDIVLESTTLNHVPRFLSTPLDVVELGSVYVSRVRVEDLDGDPLTLELAPPPEMRTARGTPPPMPSPTLEIEPFGDNEWAITFTPTENNLGRHAFALRAFDGFGGEALQDFVVEVVGLAESSIAGAGRVSSVPPAVVRVGDTFTYQLEVAGIPETVALEIDLVEAPSAMAVGAAGGLITWAPTASDIGPHVVMLEVVEAFPTVLCPSCDGPLVASQSFEIEVVDDPLAPFGAVLSATPEDFVLPPAATQVQVDVRNVGDVAGGFGWSARVVSGASWLSFGGSSSGSGNGSVAVDVASNESGSGARSGVVRVSATTTGGVLLFRNPVDITITQAAPDGPPTVLGVETVSSPFGAELVSSTETLNSITQFAVRFSEPVFGSVRELGTYRLMEAGVNGLINTAPCAAVSGDDVDIPVERVLYDLVSATATVGLDPWSALGPGTYRLVVCDQAGASQLVDLAGMRFDGDANGTAGGDFALDFQVGSENLLVNPNFDLDTSGWTLSSPGPNEIEHVIEDAAATPTSGAAQVTNLTGVGAIMELEQCVELSPTIDDYGVGAQARVTLGLGQDPNVTAVMELYNGSGCTGVNVANESRTLSRGDTAGAWVGANTSLPVPGNAQSARVTFRIDAGAAGDFVATLDSLYFGEALVLFADGFESGDTTVWSRSIP